MVSTAGFCKTCDDAVWLPHEQHPDAVIVEYDAGRAPLLRRGRPRSPTLLEIKRYRRGLAAQLIADGGFEEGVAVLEELVRHTDREPASEEERILDYGILGDLAHGLIRLWRLERAQAILARVPLNTRWLDEERRRDLGLRGIVHARLGEHSHARQDRDRLYAHDPLHPLIAEIERELIVTMPSGHDAFREDDVRRQGSWSTTDAGL